MKPCPFCAENIQNEAIKCKHCGSALNGSIPQPQNMVSQTNTKKQSWMLSLLFKLILGMLAFIFVLSIITGILSHDSGNGGSTGSTEVKPPTKGIDFSDKGLEEFRAARQKAQERETINKANAEYIRSLQN